MEFLASFDDIINNQADLDFYDLKSLFEKNLIFGAPQAATNNLQKILETDEIFAESPETIKAFEDANCQTSGVRLRFYTDSANLCIKTEIKKKYALYKICLSGSSGFDIYLLSGSKRYHMTVIAPEEPYNIFTHTVKLPRAGTYEIYFPLYNSVLNFSLGLDKASALTEAAPFAENRSVIFYGHSGTQGASASRSGNAYPNIVARKLDCEIFNYSFSAACRAELAMAKAIAQNHEVDTVKAIVVDYNRNAKTLYEFRDRYMPFYNELRKHYQNTPIILIGAFMQPLYDNYVKQFFKEMKSNGDNTYFIDLQKLFANLDILSLTPDKIHYTDTGMFMVADKICDIISRF